MVQQQQSRTLGRHHLAVIGHVVFIGQLFLKQESGEGLRAEAIGAWPDQGGSTSGLEFVPAVCELCRGAPYRSLSITLKLGQLRVSGEWRSPMLKLKPSASSAKEAAQVSIRRGHHLNAHWCRAPCPPSPTQVALLRSFAGRTEPGCRRARVTQRRHKPTRCSCWGCRKPKR